MAASRPPPSTCLKFGQLSAPYGPPSLHLLLRTVIHNFCGQLHPPLKTGIPSWARMATPDKSHAQLMVTVATGIATGFCAQRAQSAATSCRRCQPSPLVLMRGHFSHPVWTECPGERSHRPSIARHSLAVTPPPPEASVPVWLGWCRRRSGPMAYTPLDARAILAPTPNGSFTSGLPPIARLPIARLLARPRLWTSRPRPYASALDDSRAGRPYVYASLRIPRRVLRTGRAGRPAIGLRRSGRHPPPTNTHERCTSHNAAERNPGCHASPLGDCHPRSHGIKESAGNPDWVASAPVPGPPPPPLSARWGFMQVCPFWLARHTPRSRFNPLNCAHDISRPVSALPLAQSHHTEDSTI